MRTRTIYNAMSGAYRTIIFSLSVDDFLHRKARQWAKFERELLRRMDERDTVIPAARCAADAHFDWVVSDDQSERAAVMSWDAAMMKIHSAFTSQARHI